MYRAGKPLHQLTTMLEAGYQRVVGRNGNFSGSSSNNSNRKQKKTDGKKQSEEYRFIYFNSVNLALKISLNGINNNNGSSKRVQWPLSPSELCDVAASELDHSILRTIDDIHSDFASKNVSDSSQDVMIKTASGGWLCARRSQHRELYVILAEHLSALQASDALEALCSEFFSTVLC
jgi:hypothetical protein